MATPMVLAAARKLCENAATACNVDPNDYWKTYSQSFIEDAADVLAAARVVDLIDDLRTAATTLRRYEALHRAKGTEDSLAKAKVNEALAARFEATLDRAIRG